MKNKLPKIALGAWAWGNDGVFGGPLSAESLKPVFDAAMENGLNLWDTAFVYGMGQSDRKNTRRLYKGFAKSVLYNIR